MLLKESVSCVSYLCSSAQFLHNGVLSVKLKCVHFRICVAGQVTASSSHRWRWQTIRLPSFHRTRTITRSLDPVVNRFVQVSVALRNIPKRVSTSQNRQFEGDPLFGCPRLLFRCIHRTNATGECKIWHCCLSVRVYQYMSAAGRIYQNIHNWNVYKNSSVLSDFGYN